MQFPSLGIRFSMLFLPPSKHITVGVHKRQTPQQASEESIFRTNKGCYQPAYVTGTSLLSAIFNNDLLPWTNQRARHFQTSYKLT